MITVPTRRDLRLVLRQRRYDLRALGRKRGRGLFTFAFPLTFLVIFTSINQGTHITGRGGIAYDDFFVPGILAYSVISTTFVNMAISTAILRDEGVLKRMQGTPLPRGAYVGGRIVSTGIIVLAMATITLTLGKVAYGLPIRAQTLPAVALALLQGTAVFTTPGIGIARFIPNAETAAAVVNLAILPLRFISGDPVRHRRHAAVAAGRRHAFPVRALADALQHAFDPRTTGAELKGGRPTARW